jgi:hypothetical protein
MKRKERVINITQNDFDNLSFIDPNVSYNILSTENNSTLVSKTYVNTEKNE